MIQTDTFYDVNVLHGVNYYELSNAGKGRVDYGGLRVLPATLYYEIMDSQPVIQATYEM